MTAAPDVAAERTRIAGLPVAKVRAAWRARFGDDPPAFRARALVVRAYLYRLQVQASGGMKPALKSRLTALATKFAADPDHDPAPRRAPAVGSALVRDWNGVRHVVLVTADGFQYGDRTYGSLTQVARAISGTHWSGPRFFGLTS